MNNNSDNSELIKCDVCLKEVPISGAKSVETSDYVAHFCGLDCYDKWLKKTDEEKQSIGEKKQ